MGFFRPMNSRRLSEFFNDVCNKWDAMSEKDRAGGEFINPDEPVVLHVPNPEWQGNPGEYSDDEEGNEREIYFHVISVGGGGDVDQDGNECGHDGASLGGEEIDQRKFLGYPISVIEARRCRA